MSITECRINENIKILSYFGSDIKNKSQDYLQQVYHEGYTLLPLDISAIELANSAKLPYSWIDDWIDTEKLVEAMKIAIESERLWFEIAREEFTSDGICWPEFDRHAMYWFWREAIVASFLSETFSKRNVKDLNYFKNKIPRPSLYYYPSDIFSTVWEKTLVFKGEKLIADKNYKLNLGFWRVINYIRRNIRDKMQYKQRTDIITDPYQVNSLAGKLVLAFNSGEFHRFSPIIHELSNSFPGMVAAVILDYNQAVANLIAEKWSIPVVCGPPSEPRNLTLCKNFIRGYYKTLEYDADEPWGKYLRLFNFHFKYYCHKRWPMLVNKFRFWKRLWNDISPAVVMVSSLYDAESRLPAEAATCLNIPTFSLPHGAVQTSDNLVSSEYIFCSFPLQMSAWEQAGIKSSRLIPCRNIVAKNEYPSINRPSPFPLSGWRLLALTDPISWADRRLLLGTSVKAQLLALQTLNNPPVDILDKLILRVKVHPEKPDQISHLVGDGFLYKVLPLDTELESLLPQTDLIVAVNYSGSALIHILYAGKPVIFFWTEPLYSNVFFFKAGKMFIQGGELAQTPEELWNLVRKFFTNLKFAKEMSIKAQNFYLKNLDDSMYPKVDEVILRMFDLNTDKQQSVNNLG